MPTHTDEATRLLEEARKVLASVSPEPIWKRTVKRYQAQFGKLVRVELTRGLRLRVICPKSGKVLSEGPAQGPATREAQ